MEVDTVITLDDGKEFQILLENKFADGDYLLGVELDKNEEYTKNFMVFERKIIDGEEYVDDVENEEILEKLMIDFQVQYKHLAEELAEEEGIDIDKITN